MIVLLVAMSAATAGSGPEAGIQREQGGAPPGDGPPPVVVYDGSAGQLEVPNPWVDEADIKIDGQIDEAVWLDAPVLTGFTQFDPVEGVPATQRTEARVLVTDEAIYFAVTAYDDVTGGVRATLGNRDSFARSDDYVRVILDTFDDQRRGYVIMVNPYGVQQDGLWVVGSRGGRERHGPPIDWNPDFVWDSGGHLFNGGYSVEVKVPFKSIRFREEAVQDWGLQIERRIARNGYSESWAPVSANVANKMQQFGTLTGLRELDPGLFFEVNPVQTFTKQGTYDSEAGAFAREGIDGDFGLNLTYGITSNLTLDGTYNPDFSQVEADAGQIRVNERFAIHLREKRPFFLEGTEIFKLAQQLVYTRSIINPVAGCEAAGQDRKLQRRVPGRGRRCDRSGQPAREHQAGGEHLPAPARPREYLHVGDRLYRPDLPRQSVQPAGRGGWALPVQGSLHGDVARRGQPHGPECSGPLQRRNVLRPVLTLWTQLPVRRERAGSE